MPRHPLTSPNLEVFFGCVRSGKTEKLDEQMRRLFYARLRYLVFSPDIDNRKERSIRLLQPDAIDLHNSEELLVFHDREPKNVPFGIDEAQFLDLGLAKTAEFMAGDGRRIVCAGLGMDFKEEGFGPMPNIISRATIVHQCFAICYYCGMDATRSFRTDESTETIQVGEHYIPLCLCCYKKAIRNRQSIS